MSFSDIIIRHVYVLLVRFFKAYVTFTLHLTQYLASNIKWVASVWLVEDAYFKCLSDKIQAWIQITKRLNDFKAFIRCFIAGTIDL